MTGPLRRVLMIAYSFPPVGGAGVQRPVKWTKFLPEFGWSTSVLTVSNPSVPVLDESLTADIPPETVIVRAKTYEPGYGYKQKLAEGKSASPNWRRAMMRPFKRIAKTVAHTCLQPDPQVLWIPEALRVGRKLLRSTPHTAILVTAPPYSACLIGMRLSREFGLPLVLDFRDEWDLSNRYLEHATRGSIATWAQSRLQRRVLRSADAIVATTQASTRHLANRVESLGKRVPAVCVYNGYDSDDFCQASQPANRANSPALPSLQEPAASGEDQANTDPATRQFRIIYTGTLWNLTDVRPLVDAIRLAAEWSPKLVERLHFTCLGRKTPEQQAIVSELKDLPCQFEDVDYLPHSQMIKRLKQTDATVLLLSDVPGAERVVPAKLFEYLANQREIVTIAPEGETCQIVRSAWPESVFAPSDRQKMAHWLLERLATGPQVWLPEVDSRIEKYSRRSQTSQLADVLNLISGTPIGEETSFTRDGEEVATC